MEIVPENLALKKAKLEDVAMPHAARLIFEYKINPEDVIGKDLKLEMNRLFELVGNENNNNNNPRPDADFSWLRFDMPCLCWYMHVAALNYAWIAEFECTQCHTKSIMRFVRFKTRYIQSATCGLCKSPAAVTIMGFYYPLTYAPFMFHTERQAIKQRIADLLWKAHLRNESPYLSILPRDVFIKILALCGLRKCQIDAPFAGGAEVKV